MKVGFYSNLTIRTNGSTQLRCMQPAEYLRAQGHDVRVQRIHQSYPRKGELVILHRAFLDEYTKAFIASAKAQGCAVFYDTDDLLFELEGSEYLVEIGKKNYKDYLSALAAMQACHHVTVSTGYLAERAEKYLPGVTTILNGLSQNYLALSDTIYSKNKTRQNTEITLAYLCGSSTHNRDFKIIENALLQVLKKHSHLKLLLVGPLKFKREFYRFGKQFEHRAFIPYEAYAKIFAEVDLNLVPLEQKEMFCQAKSELKFIEAGICGVPSLVTPTHPHKQAITNGVDSAFADDNEWEEAIDYWLKNPNKLKALGEAARKTVFATYGPQQRAKQWQELLLLAKPFQRRARVDFGLARAKMFFRFNLQNLKRSLRKLKNG